MSAVSGEEEDDAAQAFEALCGEVASLRRGIELVYRQGQEMRAEAKSQADAAAGSSAAGPGVDYSLTLGQMQKSLQVVQNRLEVIEGKPALMMKPEVYRERIEDMGRVAGRMAGQAMSEGASAQRRATEELKEMLGKVRTKREQNRWLIAVGFMGVLSGVVVWSLAVENMPWGWGTWLAAVSVGGNKWDVGQEMLREADRASFEKMVTLYNTCGQQPVEFCQEAIAARVLGSVQPETPLTARHQTAKTKP